MSATDILILKIQKKDARQAFSDYMGKTDPGKPH